MYDEYSDRQLDDSARTRAQTVADFDADETECPACGTRFPTAGAERCPDCGLRFRI
ncbi:MAG: zinc ribbon domain-containing protein [Planctomycetota bacterium]